MLVLEEPYRSVVLLRWFEEAPLRLAPLPRGRWLVGVDETSGGAAKRPGEKTVEVNGTGATVTLE